MGALSLPDMAALAPRDGIGDPAWLPATPLAITGTPYRGAASLLAIPAAAAWSASQICLMPPWPCRTRGSPWCCDPQAPALPRRPWVGPRRRALGGAAASCGAMFFRKAGKKRCRALGGAAASCRVVPYPVVNLAWGGSAGRAPADRISRRRLPRSGSRPGGWHGPPPRPRVLVNVVPRFPPQKSLFLPRSFIYVNSYVHGTLRRLCKRGARNSLCACAGEEGDGRGPLHAPRSIRNETLHAPRIVTLRLPPPGR